MGLHGLEQGYLYLLYLGYITPKIKRMAMNDELE
jgi:hypothetical protein